MKRLTIFILAAAMLLLPSCARSRSVTETRFLMDTFASVTIYGTDDESLLDAAFDEIERLDAILSISSPDGDLARLRENAGKEYIAVSTETLELIEDALYYSSLTDGAFDITAGPLIELWDINGAGHVPTDEERTAAMELTGYGKLLISDGRVMLEQEGMSVNLGAIAKGYIADKVCELLSSLGVESAVVSLGGNVAVIGSRPGGKPFRIGLQDPRGETGESLGVIEASDISLVTSGSYERYFEADGVRYHHILDPFTGFPSESGLLSVTIITASSEAADALSTSVFLLGPEKGMELIESLPETECIMITESGDILCSSGAEGLLITE